MLQFSQLEMNGRSKESSDASQNLCRILLVDDHPTMRVGIAAAVERSPGFAVAGEADNAEEAIKLIQDVRPDVVLLDIRLPGGTNGIELARTIRTEAPKTKIVVFTNFPHEPYVRAMMNVGVQGYLLKDTPPGELVEAIGMIHRGRSVYSESISSGIVKGYVNAQGEGETDGKGSQLSSREGEVLQLVSDGLTNGQIAEALDLSSKAVEFQLTSLYHKLGASNRTEAVVIAARRGLVVIE